MAGQTLYFFTQLKKASPKGSRFIRKIGFDIWQGEDIAKHILSVGFDDQILGFKKRFKYESHKNLEQNGKWIMHEFTINPALLGDQYSHRALDFVLCCVKKHESKNLSKKELTLKDIWLVLSKSCSQNGQQRVEAEAVCIQQNQTNDIPCSSCQINSFINLIFGATHKTNKMCMLLFNQPTIK